MKKSDLLLFTSALLIVVIASIGYNVYRKLTTSTVTQIQTIQVSPIDPTFDVKTIEKLESRKKVLPINSVSASLATSAGQTVSAPQASPSGESGGTTQ